MPHFENQICVGAIGSMTQALKGVRALQQSGLRAEVVALSAEETKRGCAYGISFACEEMGQVRSALRQAQVTVTQYLQRRALP